MRRRLAVCAFALAALLLSVAPASAQGVTLVTLCGTSPPPSSSPVTITVPDFVAPMVVERLTAQGFTFTSCPTT